MSNPKVSISVPVYNADKYLRQCLDSLCSQTLLDIEIVVVNDGSTDGSENIIREYAAQDSRIILICKENGGSASARQAALDASTGLYICSCDADDWVEPDMYERLYQKAIETDADIIMCDYYSEYNNGKTHETCYGKTVPANNEQIINGALNGSFPCSVWSKMFKRDIFDKYNLSWEQGINMGEDFLMTLKIFKFPVSISYFQKCLYHYRRMPGESSYTNRVTLKSYNEMLRIQDWIENNYSQTYYDKGRNHYLINIAYAGLRVDEGMTSDYYNQTSIKRLSVINLIKEHSLKSLVILWTKILGYRNGVTLYRMLYKSVYK